MNWLIKIMGSWVTLLVVLVAVYGLYRYMNPVAVARFALTVEVEVDGKLVSGTSVMEGRFWRQHAPLGTPYQSSFQGEAVVVDLAGRGLLFTLLHDEFYNADAFMLPERVFKRTHQIPRDQDVPVESDTRLTQRLALEKLTGCADLKPEEWPLLVRFQNPLDPSTVEKVDRNNLTASFGRRVALSRMFICASEKPLTSQISRVLPWLAKMSGQPLIKGKSGASTIEIPLAARLDDFAFRRTQ